MSDAAIDNSSPPPCVVMTLPDELLIPAARTSTLIFPANAPAAVAHAILPPQEVAAITSRYWGPKPRTISVQFLDNPTATFRRMFLAAANSWDCCITFAETAETGELRLTRSGRGYWSYLGTDILHIPAPAPTMNLQGFTEFTREADWLRVPPHEIGHTLGFPHDHLRRAIVDRIDRTKVYAYFWEWQRWPPRTVDVNVMTAQEESELLDPTPADVNSIMTYPLPGEIMIDGVPVPGGDRLTKADLDYADRIYPVPKPPAPPPGPPPPVEPEPQKPEPAEPEDPAPYDLRVGVESDRFTALGDSPILVRFKAPRKASYVASTRGKAALHMDLLDAKKAALESDRDFSGVGANALIAATLKKGTYYLRIRGAHPEAVGKFSVKVGIVP